MLCPKHVYNKSLQATEEQVQAAAGTKACLGSKGPSQIAPQESQDKSRLEGKQSIARTMGQIPT